MFTQRRQSKLTLRRSRATILSTMFGFGDRRSFRPMSQAFDQESKLDPPPSALSGESFTIQHVITPSPIIFATSLSASLPTPKTLPRTDSSGPLGKHPSVILDRTGPREVSMYGKRVVVRYRHGRAPTLDLRRFSKLQVPLPETEELPSAEVSSPDTATSEGSPTTPEQPSLYSLSDPLLPTKPSRVLSLPVSKSQRTCVQNLARLTMLPSGAPGSYANDSFLEISPASTNNPRFSARTTTTTTTTSRASDAFEAVHALTMQFPGIPGWKLAAMHHQQQRDSAVSQYTSVARTNSSRSTDGASGLVRRSSSVKRKPVPKLEEVMEEAEHVPSPKRERERERPKTYTPGVSTIASESDAESHKTAKQRPVTHTPTTTAQEERARRQSRSRSRSRSRGRSRSSSRSRRGSSASAAEYPGNPILSELIAQDQAELDAAWKQLGEKKRARKTRAESIKSIGSVASRRTPSVSTASQRSSMVPEWVVVSGEQEFATSRRNMVSRFSDPSTIGY